MAIVRMKNIMKIMPVIFLVAVVFASGCTSQSYNAGKGDAMHNDTMMEHNGTMMKNDSMAKYEGSILAGTSSVLLDFNKADYDKALQSDKLVVLYFYANWCPICAAEVPELKSAFNELTTDKVIGFRVNFNDGDTDDNEKNLARQFGVPYQHTKVFVKNSQQVLKSSETWDKARYLEEINKAL